MSRQELCRLARLVSSCFLTLAADRVLLSHGFALVATTTY